MLKAPNNVNYKINRHAFFFSVSTKIFNSDV